MPTTKQAHTPGPWIVDVDGDRLTGRIMAPDMAAWIGDVRTYPHRWSHAMDKAGEWESNAHLIAAAPELLAALESIIDDYANMCHILYGQDYNEMGSALEQQARTVIAKAKGE
jgi:hypothetical protein